MINVLLFSRIDIFAEALAAMLVEQNFAQVTMSNSEELDCLGDHEAGETDVVLINAKSLQYPLDEFFQHFCDWHPGVKILVFGADDNDIFVRNLVRCGAHGFLNDETQAHQLREAVEWVMKGKLHVSRDLLDQIAMDAFEIERMIESSIKERIAILGEQLTPRENDIFRLLLDGLSTKEIAAKLHVSEQSVKLYLNRLFRKFNVKNRSQLILIAFERVCPVQNMIKLFRITLDRRRTANGQPPVIPDPLDE